MITAADAAITAGTPRAPVRRTIAQSFVPMTSAARTAAASAVVPLRERILLIVLFIAVLASSIAFIEPSPHDALMGVLAVACLVAGVRFNRNLTVLVFWLVIFNVCGLLSLINALDIPKTVQYTATSLYLAIAAILFACLFSENTMARLASMRVAYIITATFAGLAGAAGYFHAFPGAQIFAPEGRALATFKDPNVYGPFLIWPALYLMNEILTRRIRLLGIAALGGLLLGLLLSFSRGAWFHFALSAMITIALSFLTARTQKTRLRIFILSAVSVVLLVAAIAVLISIPAVQLMVKERVHLINSYDVGQGGRFRMQEMAVTSVLLSPNGLGPFGFATAAGVQQHNQYLQAFLVYGWVGGMAYIMLLLSTVYVGLRAAFRRTPWQPYMITALGAFLGEMAEGFIVDTDHWRHFFLLLGMIWGLAAATLRGGQPSPPAVGRAA